MHDGTRVRDYIHMMDLAEGYLAALDFLVRMRAQTGGDGGVHTFNLGTGWSAGAREISPQPGW